MTDTPPNVYSFLIALVTLIGAVAAPVVTWLVTRNQTKTVQADLAVNAGKLDAVHETTTKTEVLVNGDRIAKERRIAALEATLRAHGIDAP